MSIVSTLTNVIVEHEGNIVFDSHSGSNPCDNIRDIKREIERQHAFSIGSQLLCFDKTLLPENIRLDDLRFKYNSAVSLESSQGTANLNRPIKLTLTTPKGQVNIKVNIISNQVEPISISIVVYGATSVYQLRDMIH